MIALWDIAAESSARRQKWNPHRASLQRECNGEVGQVENLDLVVLHRSTKVVGLAHHHVANPRGNDLLYASCADHLVEEYVGYWPDECESALILSDDLVSGSKGDHLLKLKPERNGR